METIDLGGNNKNVNEEAIPKNKIKLTRKRFNLTLGALIGMIIGMVITSALSILIYRTFENGSKNQAERDQMMRLAYYITLEREQEYWNVKGEVINHIKTFIDKNAPFNNLSPFVLLLECDKANIDVRLPMAQGFVEGHYATKGLSAQTNNLCNVGAYDGLSYEEISSKHKHPHVNESIAPYLELLNKKYLVKGKREWDLLDNFVDNNGNRYASNPLYEQELYRVIERINSETQLDSLLQKYNYLRKELNR